MRMIASNKYRLYEATSREAYSRNFDAAVIVTSCSLRRERVDITQEIGEIKPFTIDRVH